MTRSILCTVFAMALSATAFAQETDEVRSARLAEFRNNNARFAMLADKTRSASTALAPLPQAITLSVPKPLFYTTGVQGQAVKWAADVNKDGRADVGGTFWAGKDGGRAVALGSFGGYMYAHDGRSSILRFTDTNQDGVADQEPDEVFAGAVYTEHLMPYAVDKLFLQDNGRPRLLRYNVGIGSATTNNINLPQLSQSGQGWVDGTIYSPELRTIYTIDRNEDKVLAFTVSADGSVGKALTLIAAKRIANIAVDGTNGLLIVLQAGECISAPQTPSVPGNDGPVASICYPGKLTAVRLPGFTFLGGSSTLATGNFMYNVEYSSQPHSMTVIDAKVYLVVFTENPNFSRERRQMIVTYDIVGKAVDNQNGTIFLGEQEIGDAFISSLCTFPGGPVNNISVNVP